MSNSWRRAGVEPSVEEMLEDPIVGLLMQYDGVDPSDVRRALTQAGEALLRESDEVAADMAAAKLTRRA